MLSKIANLNCTLADLSKTMVGKAYKRVTAVNSNKVQII